MTSERTRTAQRLMALYVMAAFFSSASARTVPALQLELKPAQHQQEPNKPDGQKKWDVNSPPGPFQAVEIDTDEGTWISVDVSPAGSDIIFDFLGDIYRIPITGGAAQPLTSGIPWDMQPRYSPDGRYIAFTSDRGGGDNIWVMNTDGSNPRPVTKEDFRLLNSPVWTPDGQFIAARKHFTAARSLGAGEIWLYHASGGEGVQMTKRPNDQKDLGEPAFSPDGRYLYFSQDTTPGEFFEYSKDVNKEIYDIKRLDRQTGEIEDFATGPGGSIRPTASPDGRYLAFIRRVRFKSTLFLQEIKSSAEWPIYDGLDRDMQETWAIHGVYPSIAWMPDSKSIVFWAGGKIHRIDIRTNEVSVIPFSIKTTRQVARALRWPVKVAADNFKVKMLRWVQTSGDGKRVAFQALGHIYLRDLPDGKPQRLTSQLDHFEFFPSWSPDGRSIVYTTFSDEMLGSVRIADVSTGESRIITPAPGHYVEPVFSPDATKIVYRKTTADLLRSPTWTREPGIYWIPVEGGQPTLVTKNATNPHFGSDNNRIYLLEVSGQPPDARHALMSIELDGSDRRTHFVSKNATEYRISPDENWLAFVEGFNAYITPFVRSGKEVEIGPKTTSIPLKQVSRDAGVYLHWSADSKKLYWALGPQLFERSLSDAFDFFAGSPEKLPEPPQTGLDIGFETPADTPTGQLALKGARIITMRGDEVIENGTILIDRNRIAAVGPKNQVRIPDTARVIDVSGCTIIPGIVDVHSHGPYGSEGLIPQANWWRYADIAFGVTTSFDPSNDTATIFAASELQRAGRITAPRIFSTGTILYGAAGPAKAEINSLDDARSHLRRMKAAGAFCVKNYNQPRREQRQQIIAAARELEMMVVAEGASLFHMDMTLIIDGQTGLEHPIPLARLYDDVITLWAATGTACTPTLIVGYGGIWGENYWYQHANIWENQRLLTFVPRKVIDPRSRRRLLIPEEEFHHFDLARNCKRLVDAGGHVQLGAHGQLAGLGAHWELWMLAQGGLTSLQAIHAATLDGARYLGLDGDIGSLQPGKLADLVVLERNILEDIHNSQYIRYTVINGRIYDAATADQLGNHPAKRPKFYWEIDYRSKN